MGTWSLLTDRRFGDPVTGPLQGRVREIRYLNPSRTQGCSPNHPKHRIRQPLRALKMTDFHKDWNDLSTPQFFSGRCAEQKKPPSAAASMQNTLFLGEKAPPARYGEIGYPSDPRSPYCWAPPPSQAMEALPSMGKIENHLPLRAPKIIDFLKDLASKTPSQIFPASVCATEMRAPAGGAVRGCSGTGKSGPRTASAAPGPGAHGFREMAGNVVIPLVLSKWGRWHS